ncbi:restriction endonuclease subunit S [Streptomyces sp. NBC_01767]|nr:restriction endonuclease subunit S [Streptomyces sp. NBC_01767]WSX01590.1 restriction endonuclease subunit S [Streptomyces sp. NBC_00987]
MAGEAWKSVRLYEVLEDVFAGAWGDSPSDSRSPNVHVLRATNIDSEGRVNYSKPALRVLVSREVSRKRLLAGDLLLEASGGGPGTPVGRVALHDGGIEEQEYVCSNFFRVLRPNRKVVHPDYLRHLLVWVYHSPAIWRYQQQTTGLVNLKLKDYLEHPLLVPPLGEQERVVDVLRGFSEAERGIEASIAKLELLRSGVMEELEALECGTFGDVLAGGPQNGIYKPGDAYGLVGTPIVRIDSFSGGLSDFRNGLLRVLLGKSELSRYALDVGDIVINRVNTPGLVGKSTEVRLLAEPTVFESNMMRCRVRTELAAPAFVETWLGGTVAKSHFQARAKSAISQASINGSDVRGCPFPQLGVSEQLAFLRRLDAVRDQQQSELAELTKLRTLKQGLVDDLLAGRA